IEAQAREQSPAERQMLRQTQALPRLQALHAWLIQQRQQTTKTSGYGRALDYSIHRWEALSRYAQTGDLPIDN
ncbi:IS66 family transposase, partial [Parachitinimonas caeni]